MSKKIRIGILFGGRSAEHEVSLRSANNIINALDKDKYDVVLIGIDKSGQWYLNESSTFLLNATDAKNVKLGEGGTSVVLKPGQQENQLVPLSGDASPNQLDVVFPVLHGTYGEDGTMQGLLKLADIPFVGPGVLGSAVCMDKDVSKRLMREAGIPVAKAHTYKSFQRAKIDLQQVEDDLGFPCFIKPANLGSSVGISKATTQQELSDAIDMAFRFDHKIIIEEMIEGREIECSVLGNDEPIVSIPGEILPQHDFYSYEAKYLDDKGALLEIPAKLNDEQVKAIQDLAIRTYQTLCCEGLSRVDVFLCKDDKIYVNEVNTLPGFTRISMYPKLWEASGISYSELLDRLIQLAIERGERERKLETSITLG